MTEPNRHYRAFRENGDLDALARLFDETAPKLLALARRLGSGRGEAEDWVQETFLKVLEKPEALPADGDVVPWLLGVLVNRARDERRRAARQPEPDRLVQREVEAPDKGLSAAEVRAAIEAAIEDLPPAQRRAVAGKLLDGRSTEELGAELRVAPDAVRARLHRGLERLRAVLPLGLATGLFAWLTPTRGLAGVRARVLEKAAGGVMASGVKVSATATVGVMMLKKFVVAGVIGALAWLVYSATTDALAPQDLLAVDALEPEAELANGALLAGEAVGTDLQSPGQAEAPGRMTAAVVEAAVVDDSAPGLIKVRVLNEDGEAVRKAMASARYSDLVETPGITRPPQGKSDRTGWAEFEVAPGRDFILTVHKLPDSSIEKLEVSGLEPGEVRELTVTILTKDDQVFTGRVLSEDGGQPVVGVSVWVDFLLNTLSSRGSRSFAPERERDAVTDADGFFEVRGRSWTETIASISGLGWSPLRVELAAGGTQRIVTEVRMRRGARISGVLTGVEGRAFEVQVTTPQHYLMEGSGGFLHGIMGDVRFTARVDSGGRFDLAGLPSRVRLTVRVVAGRDVGLQLPDPLTLEPDEERQVAWSLDVAGSIRGRVVDVDGKPEAGLYVSLFLPKNARPGLLSSNQKRTATTRSDSHGRFEFKDVQPGTWTVGLVPTSGGSRGGNEDHAPVAIVAQQPADGSDLEVELVVYRGLFIEGTVRTPDGMVLETSVFLHSEESGVALVRSCEGNGTFKVGPLPEGEFQLLAGAPGSGEFARSESVTVRAGESGLELFLRTGAKLSGRVAGLGEGQTGRPMVQLSGVADSWRATSLGENGSFSFSGLLEGTYGISLTTDDGRVGYLAGLAVSPGEHIADLRMQLQRGGTLLIHYTGAEEFGRYRVERDGVLIAGDRMRAGTQKRVVVPAGMVDLLLGNERSQVFITLGEQSVIRFGESD